MVPVPVSTYLSRVCAQARLMIPPREKTITNAVNQFATYLQLGETTFASYIRSPRSVSLIPGRLIWVPGRAQ